MKPHQVASKNKVRRIQQQAAFALGVDETAKQVIPQVTDRIKLARDAAFIRGALLGTLLGGLVGTALAVFVIP